MIVTYVYKCMQSGYTLSISNERVTFIKKVTAVLRCCLRDSSGVSKFGCNYSMLLFNA